MKNDNNFPSDAVVLRAAGAIHMESGVTVINNDGATGRKAIDSQKGARAFITSISVVQADGMFGFKVISRTLPGIHIG